MYEDLTISSRCAEINRRAVAESIAAFKESAKVSEDDKKYRAPFQEEDNMLTRSMIEQANAQKRFSSFSETVRTVFLTEALYKVFKDSVMESSIKEPVDKSIMRSIVNQYITENGYGDILHKMKSTSVEMSKLYNVVTETVSKVLECVDKNKPETFAITNDMKDEFFKQLDYSNSDEISKAINDRVVSAMDNFVTANTKDHDDIENALQRAQEKINQAPEEDTDLKESYNYQAKREISGILNASKGILHSMITAMGESVMKHPEMQGEFMVEGHLDMDKVVRRTSMMYTFLEMLNTTKLEKINEAYLEDVIANLKK